MRRLLGKIRRAGFKLNREKCSFLKNRLEYLGHEVSAKGVQPGVSKTQAVREFPQTTQVHQVRQFIGLTSYFRKFVKNYARIVKPLTGLTKQSAVWKWEAEEEGVFLKLRDLVQATSVSSLP